MARPREFDESVVLVAKVRCFWSRQYGTTCVRDLAGSLGITGMGDYNAFGDKRSLYRRSLDVNQGLGDRVRRFDENLSSRKSLSAPLLTRNVAAVWW
jgi:TetR/AcrR family transcriptional repressor of nem operon